jgi:hypothetical protein
MTSDQKINLTDMAVKMKDTKEYETEVLAAIGRWAVRNPLQHRSELVREMFDDVVKEFIGYYPQHKILSHLCQELQEPELIEPGGLLQRIVTRCEE